MLTENQSRLYRILHDAISEFHQAPEGLGPDYKSLGQILEIINSLCRVLGDYAAVILVNNISDDPEKFVISVIKDVKTYIEIGKKNAATNGDAHPGVQLH
jgi:hypothetical protein